MNSKEFHDYDENSLVDLNGKIFFLNWLIFLRLNLTDTFLISKNMIV